MSPQSRGRKHKPRTRGVRRAKAPNPLESFLRVFAPVVAEADPVQAELAASAILGPAFEPLRLDGADPVLALVEYLGTRPTVPALCLSRATAVVGWTDEQRAAGAAAADQLAGLGVAEPPWLADLGTAAFVDAWQLGDVYGDQATLLCSFEQAGRRHGALVLLDFNHLGGYAKDLAITEEVAETLADLRTTVKDSAGIAVLEQLTPERARRLIEAGIDATDTTISPDVGEDYATNRAFVLAQCRAMPAPEAHEYVEVARAQRDELIDAFLGDCAGRADASWRYCASLLVDYGCDYDAGQPLRVGPGKLESLLLGYLPRKVVMDAADRAALPDVVRAWVRWAGARTGLAQRAIDELVETVDELLDDFDARYDDDANASPLRAMLSGLGQLSGSDEAESVLDRRTFAMPYFGTRIGDEDYPRLDPSDEDERHLLVVGEHPEFHAALGDPSFDGEVDGVNPRLHIALDEIVINQLWDDDPPEVWQAAQRLRARGMERLDIIHEIGSVLVARLHASLTSGQPIDVPAYASALGKLAPAHTRRGRRSAREVASASVRPDDVLQVKITLRGSRPPIWRRLRLPGWTALDAVHDLVQVCFGWEDSHLHLFEAGGTRYAPGEFDLGRTRPSGGVQLGDVLGGVGAKLRYEYDLGDSWQHDVVVENLDAADGIEHAVCVAGRRAGPVEDCGGVGGWEYLCEVLADPAHPDYAERFEWLGFAPDPAAFDLDAVNAALRHVSLIR